MPRAVHRVTFGDTEVKKYTVRVPPGTVWSPAACRGRSRWPRGAAHRPVYLEAFGLSALSARRAEEAEGEEEEEEEGNVQAEPARTAENKTSNRPALHLIEEERKGEDDPVLDEEAAGWFRGAAARANYLAMDRVDLAYSAKELCRRMAVPRQSDITSLRRLAKYLLGSPRLVQRYPWQRKSDFDVFVDTDFAGCPRTRRSTSGGVCLRGGHAIKHWSKTQKVVTLSSAEAELGGVVLGAGEGMGIQAVALDLGISSQLVLHADSAAAIGICNRTGIGRVRHLAVGQLWVQERIREKTLHLRKVLGTENPADLCTKYLAAKDAAMCLEATGGTLRAGRSGAAPALAAEIEPFLQEEARGRKRGGEGKRG